jgi:hypothetical protein
MNVAGTPEHGLRDLWGSTSVDDEMGMVIAGSTGRSEADDEPVISSQGSRSHTACVARRRAVRPFDSEVE